MFLQKNMTQLREYKGRKGINNGKFFSGEIEGWLILKCARTSPVTSCRPLQRGSKKNVNAKGFLNFLILKVNINIVFIGEMRKLTAIKVED